MRSRNPLSQLASAATVELRYRSVMAGSAPLQRPGAPPDARGVVASGPPSCPVPAASRKACVRMQAPQSTRAVSDVVGGGPHSADPLPHAGYMPGREE